MLWSIVACGTGRRTRPASGSIGNGWPERRRRCIYSVWALIVTMGWHDPSAAGSGATIGGLPALHLAFLMTTGAAAALFTLGSRGEALVLRGPRGCPAAQPAWINSWPR